MTEPVLTCPFCGSDNIGHYEVEDRDNHSFECHDCLAGSACKSTYNEALAAWNRRTAPPAVAGEPVARLEIGKTKGGASLTHIAEPAAFQLPEGMYALYTHPQPAAQDAERWSNAFDEAPSRAQEGGCPHGSKHIVNDCMRCGAPVCCGKCCAEDAQANGVPRLRTDVARALWAVMREHEDRCDLSLEDIPAYHAVWLCADAAIAAQGDKS